MFTSSCDAYLVSQWSPKDIQRNLCGLPKGCYTLLNPQIAKAVLLQRYPT